MAAAGLNVVTSANTAKYSTDKKQQSTMNIQLVNNAGKDDEVIQQIIPEVAKPAKTGSKKPIKLKGQKF